MVFANYVTTVLLGAATLFLLALYTLSKCRAQLGTRTREYSAFLFEGLERRHSLAGTIGSTFSVTYYGATTIYGHLYRGWFVLLLIVGYVVSVLMVVRVIRAAHAESAQPAGARSNLLLDLLRSRLGVENTTHVVTLWVAIYAFLLAEELAVARVVLMTVFAQYPAIPAVLIATMCVVVAVYIRWGGFKAVLIADYEQLKLLLPFVLALGVIIYRGKDLTGAFHKPFSPLVATNIAALPLGILLMVSWKVGAVDLYSRLNFRMNARGEISDQQISFTKFSLALAVGMFVAVAFFGMSMPATFSESHTPVAFTRAGLQYAAIFSSKPALVIFVASLFSMILTTINTLVATVLQLGSYRQSKRPHVTDLSRIFLMAAFASCFFDPNAVSGVGIFIGALMIIPLLAVLAATSTRVRRLLPQDFRFARPAALTATAAFLGSYSLIATDYSRHYLLPALVVAACIVAATIGRIDQYFGGRKHVVQ